MGFNADQYAAALTPPSITWKGETYTGRLIGVDEALSYHAKIEALEDTDDNVAGLGKLRDLIAEFCEVIEIPADVVLGLPFPVMMAAIQDFFVSLLMPELGTSTTEPQGPTNGSDSQRADDAEPSA